MNTQASGNEAFDRARSYLERLREEEALDWFEVAANESDDALVRGSAAAYVAGLLLASGRPWEVETWADVACVNAVRPDLGNMLEAAAKIELDDLAGASALLELVHDPSDPYFPSSPIVARLMRAHVAYRQEHVEFATSEVLAIFAESPFSPDVWDAFARLCAETDFDPEPIVAQVPDDRVLEVLASLRLSEAAGVDRIAELIWDRKPGDPQVLALVPHFASKLDSMRALEWSARLRSVGMGRLCPLLERADDVRVGAPERVRAAALAHASFGDSGARESLELAVRALDDDELAPAVVEVWTVAGLLTDSVVVAGATNTIRSLTIAAALFEGGARTEAYAVLVHGLAMEEAEHLTTEEVLRLLPVPALHGLAAEAELRGEDDVAGILEAVAVVATDG